MVLGRVAPEKKKGRKCASGSKKIRKTERKKLADKRGGEGIIHRWYQDSRRKVILPRGHRHWRPNGEKKPQFGGEPGKTTQKNEGIFLKKSRKVFDPRGKWTKGEGKG